MFHHIAVNLVSIGLRHLAAVRSLRRLTIGAPNRTIFIKFYQQAIANFKLLFRSLRRSASNHGFENLI